jgi:retron-type reverse transcriptase
MGRLAKRIGDRRVLGLIRRYLGAGILVQGLSTERHEGTPQGGPLSPLLANVLLDEVDKELEKRGHTFVRYADDCNVYVRSRRAGERVMGLLRRLYAGLRLRVNCSRASWLMKMGAGSAMGIVEMTSGLSSPVMPIIDLPGGFAAT